MSRPASTQERTVTLAPDRRHREGENDCLWGQDGRLAAVMELDQVGLR
jgi:hypothetical protein